MQNEDPFDPPPEPPASPHASECCESGCGDQCVWTHYEIARADFERLMRAWRMRNPGAESL